MLISFLLGFVANAIIMLISAFIVMRFFVGKPEVKPKKEEILP